MGLGFDCCDDGAGVTGQSETPRDSNTSESPSPNSIFGVLLLFVVGVEGGSVGGGIGVLQTPLPGSPGSGREDGERMLASKASSSSVMDPVTPAPAPSSSHRKLY